MRLAASEKSFGKTGVLSPGIKTSLKRLCRVRGVCVAAAAPCFKW